jgi:hypothetical protein
MPTSDPEPKPILFETHAPPHHQRISCTPSPIYSLIWTALAESSPGRSPGMRSSTMRDRVRKSRSHAHSSAPANSHLVRNISPKTILSSAGRWYDQHQQTPLFPFGFGLSYTNIQYSNLSLKPVDTYVSVRVTLKTQELAQHPMSCRSTWLNASVPKSLLLN